MTMSFLCSIRTKKQIAAFARGCASFAPRSSTGFGPTQNHDAKSIETGSKARSPATETAGKPRRVSFRVEPYPPGAFA